ncbi:retinol dehydrogenase 12-like [Chironomus tepperi]|uniref:retinol dehydrogenase 12-like n=1 Tax=Chironomus tepperi TaxID=113505 RepID=UPI00391EE80E
MMDMFNNLDPAVRTVIVVLAILVVLCLLLYLLRMWWQGGQYTKNTRIDGKVVIITGGNAGIGKETAIDLAKRGGKIYIACRDLNRGQNAQAEIKEISGSDNVHFLQLDLASMESIREFSRKFHQLENKLHILINNAGVMACPKAKTSDGFELQLGTNHLGHFLLTNLLLDLLKEAAPSRVVVVSSIMHRIGFIRKNDLMCEQRYWKWFAYGQSKLSNILFARELGKRLEGSGVTANSLHPGIVNTELSRNLDLCTKSCFNPCRIFFKTPISGAQTQIMLAVDPELDNVTGRYFADCKQRTPSSAARDDETALWLWKESERLTCLSMV